MIPMYATYPYTSVTILTATKLVSIFKNDLNDIKNLVTCSICDQLLYEPWTLACGHTYCYSCLCNWFVPNKRKKTCPECRTAVKQMPAPSFVVKQMVTILMSRSEILPSDETIEQHQERAREETESVEKDRKDTLGLFKGTFTPERKSILYDEADGVTRCPQCMMEYEGGTMCHGCGQEIDPEDEHYFSDEGDDDSLDLSDFDNDSDLEGDLQLELNRNAILRRRARESLMAPRPHIHVRDAFLDHIEFGITGRITGRHHASDHESGGDLTDPPSESESDDSSGIEEWATNPTHRRRVEHRVISDSESESDERVEISRRRRQSRGSRSPSVQSVITGSEASDNNEATAMLERAGWSPLEEHGSQGSNGNRDSGDESDTETMIGYGSETPRYESLDPDLSRPGGPGFSSEEPNYGFYGFSSEDLDEVHDGGVTDGDGDTEMSSTDGGEYSNWRRNSETPGVQVEADSYGYAARESTTPSSSYGGYGGEDLGVVHNIHNLDNSSSDESDILLPPRRRPRQPQSGRIPQQRRPRVDATLVQRGIMSGNQMERNGRIHLLPPQQAPIENQEYLDFNDYILRRTQAYRQRRSRTRNYTSPFDPQPFTSFIRDP